MSEKNGLARINQESASERQSVLSLVSLTQDSRPATTGEKLAATASVLTGGIADGTITKAREALSDPTSLLKIGGSAAIGAALTFANGRQGILRLGARTAMVGLGGLFAVDLYNKGSETANLLTDTWHSPENARINREKVAQTLGPLVVDTMLYGAGGGLGVTAAKTFMPVKPRLLAARVSDLEAGAGSNSKILTDRAPHAQEPLEAGQIEFHVLEQGSVFNPNRTMKVPLESPIGKTVSIAKESVAKVEVLSLNGRGELGGGTSTAVSVTADGKLVVNKHLIDGAVSISVFDSQARPHSAHILRVNPDKEVDLAILQLDNPSSYPHFKPLEFANNPDGLQAGTQVAFLGHPEGYNHMFVSPGTVAAQPGRGVTATFHANVREGNCGSAICDMDGKLLAIMKSEGKLVNGSPVSLVRSLLESKTNLFNTGNVAPKPGQTMPYVQKFEIKEPDKALLAIEEIFGVKLKDGEAPADFYHARARKATYKNSSSQAEILLKTEYLPEHGEALIRPAAKDGKPLTNDMHWPGTTIPINTAELRLKFSNGFQNAKMFSVNDPYNILTAGFELRGRFYTYLSELKPHRLH